MNGLPEEILRCFRADFTEHLTYEELQHLHLLKRTAGTNIQNGPEKYQITGLITDAVTGAPLQAEVWIDELNGPMLKPRYSDEFGRYRRLLIEGTYNINFKLFGYENQVHTFVPSSSQITQYDDPHIYESPKRQTDITKNQIMDADDIFEPRKRRRT